MSRDAKSRVIEAILLVVAVGLIALATVIVVRASAGDETGSAPDMTDSGQPVMVLPSATPTATTVMR